MREEGQLMRLGPNGPEAVKPNYHSDKDRYIDQLLAEIRKLRDELRELRELRLKTLA